MNDVLDGNKVYGRKHLIEITQTELLITESKFWRKYLIREIPLNDIIEIKFIKLNGGNNTPRFFITMLFKAIAGLFMAIISEGGFGSASFDKDRFEIRYYHEGEEIHSSFETDLKDGDIEEMRLQIEQNTAAIN